MAILSDFPLNIVFRFGVIEWQMSKIVGIGDFYRFFGMSSRQHWLWSKVSTHWSYVTFNDTSKKGNIFIQIHAQLLLGLDRPPELRITGHTLNYPQVTQSLKWERYFRFSACARWFKPWPFYPLNLWKGHVTILKRSPAMRHFYLLIFHPRNLVRAKNFAGIQKACPNKKADRLHTFDGEERGFLEFLAHWRQMVFFLEQQMWSVCSHWKVLCSYWNSLNVV